MSPGQYVHVTAEQLGVNVELTLSDPSGKQLVDIDWWWRDETESLWAVAESGGDYTVKVIAPEQPAEAGLYRVELKKVGLLREATAAEASFISAHKLSAEGESLIAQGTKESLDRASGRLRAAAELWRDLKEVNAEGQAMSELGIAQYSPLRQLLQARETLVSMRRS